MSVLEKPAAAAVHDQFARPLRDLRLSVLDRCNLRCTYCMPAESFEGRGIFLPPGRLLSDAELEQLVRVFTSLGVHKLRITGGEPLLRPGLPELVRSLAAIDGIDDLAMTTNAMLLPGLALPLKRAGLGRITVSLDSLDNSVFREMSGGRGSVQEVLDGITAAEVAGFGKLKINTVVQKSINDHTVLDLVDHFRGSGHTVRLIEFMDVGNLNHWSREQVVPSATLLKTIHDRWDLKPVSNPLPGETARRYEFLDGQGEVGFISSITEPFCGDCSRARLTADGVFYSCLFSSSGTDLRGLVRSGISEGQLEELVTALWSGRDDRYSELRGKESPGNDKVEMFRMGG
ncbi:MAG: GTP 3',8-cyclase MoaA [Xanthomonadales bacterium]|nr:GTP 3',8-cyclase MoaA [Xanthomonadales bacterium]NNL94077.1 GTP 3',8-cyclase MoaA [Xanthomonadales bacterium]